MWDRSEKHLVLAMLFMIASQHVVTGSFIDWMLTIIGTVHIALSTYYAFKE